MKYPPLKRHSALTPWSREHFNGLVQVRRLRAAAAGDAEQRRAGVAGFVANWAAEMGAHFEDEERWLGPLMNPEDRARLLAEHGRLRGLAEEARAWVVGAGMSPVPQTEHGTGWNPVPHLPVPHLTGCNPVPHTGDFTGCNPVPQIPVPQIHRTGGVGAPEAEWMLGLAALLEAHIRWEERECFERLQRERPNELAALEPQAREIERRRAGAAPLGPSPLRERRRRTGGRLARPRGENGEGTTRGGGTRAGDAGVERRDQRSAFRNYERAPWTG